MRDDAVLRRGLGREGHVTQCPTGDANAQQEHGHTLEYLFHRRRIAWA